MSSTEGLGDRLEALLEATRAFAEVANDYQTLLNTITLHVMRLLGDGCSIFLVDAERHSARPVALANRDESRSVAVLSYFGNRSEPLDGQGTVARVIGEGKSLRLELVDPSAPGQPFRQQHVPAIAELELRSLLAVPLQVRDATIGALIISRHGEGAAPFSADDELFANTLANHAALLLRNAQLLDSLQQELKERKLAQEEAKKFVALVQRSRDFIAMAGFDGRILFVNDAGRELLGIDKDRDLGDVPLSAFHTEDGMKRAEILRAVGHWEGEGQLRHFLTGELIPTQVRSLILHSLDGEPLGFATVQRDLRETRRLEERLRQAQKMEAIGRLAGGVAHDFNNLLSVILGCSYLLFDDLPQGAPARAHVDEIHRAGERAASLTQQLLAFSRQQLLEPRVLDLNQVLHGMSQMLRRLLGEDVELKLLLDERLGRILVDPSQMEQVILNLAVNARDAMPSGGKLSIFTSNVSLTPTQAEARDFAPGDYVLLNVVDTGQGMDPATIGRIFEPFFTTKGLGQGTGLGLATVLGIVEQSRGHVLVTSQPGRGTSFDIYLPCTERGLLASVGPSAQTPPGRARGDETVLLVEDDPQVRALMRTILQQSGYRVEDVGDPLEALGLVESREPHIDLLVTDVVMPRMSGRELASRLSGRVRRGKVLYVSGYAEEALGRHGVVDVDVALLRKPITPDALRRRVREVLDA
ncbi:MAG TPA: ATP-binding protein [Polyangiaceae bacterium]|nr:ATP-binding protein [Polyangiaceae bacterium]